MTKPFLLLGPWFLAEAFSQSVPARLELIDSNRAQLASTSTKTITAIVLRDLRNLPGAHTTIAYFELADLDQPMQALPPGGTFPLRDGQYPKGLEVTAVVFDDGTTAGDGSGTIFGKPFNGLRLIYNRRRAEARAWASIKAAVGGSLPADPHLALDALEAAARALAPKEARKMIQMEDDSGAGFAEIIYTTLKNEVAEWRSMSEAVAQGGIVQYEPTETEMRQKRTFSSFMPSGRVRDIQTLRDAVSGWLDDNATRTAKLASGGVQ